MPSCGATAVSVTAEDIAAPGKPGSPKAGAALKVSFDFDDTLSRAEVQQFAGYLSGAGHEIWVVTMRFRTREDMVRYHQDDTRSWEGNDDLFRVARDLGIPESRIVFTNWEWKSVFLQGKGFVWHLDDCGYTLQNLRKNCPDLRAINSWRNSRWRRQCLAAIAEAEKTARRD